LPDDTEQTSRFLVMHLQDSNKVFKSSEDVAKSTKQYIRTPQTYQEFSVFCEGFHGVESEPAQKCRIALKLVGENPSTFKSCCNQDAKFASAFVYKLDKRYQLFMKECRDAEERDAVSTRILDYERLIEDVKMGDFVLYLPPVFSIAGDKKRKNDDGETGGPRQRNGKRGKGGKDSKRVTNEEFDDELKLSNEEWKMISGNKELLKLRPKLADDLPLCHRWQTKRC
jgi:hypothetical protein